MWEKPHKQKKIVCNPAQGKMYGDSREVDLVFWRGIIKKKMRSSWLYVYIFNILHWKSQINNSYS